MAGKYDNPPPLPHDRVARVLRVASIDGKLLLFIAGAFAILAAYTGDRVGAIVGCCAAGAGALELNGVGRIQNFIAEGVEQLIKSQLLLLAVILIYAAYQLTHFNPEEILSAVTPRMRERFMELGIGEDQYLPILRQTYQTLYVTVGVVSLFYQGGLALYYRRARPTVYRLLNNT